ncbi:MAG: hypothetical protein U0232_26540 [Thermomicrobiales bacterium]
MARAEVEAGAFDEALVNAAQLSVGLRQNRRLLRGTLRAHFAGEHDWRERYPANGRFWRSWPRTAAMRQAWSPPSCSYACGSAAGGRVRLWPGARSAARLADGDIVRDVPERGGV